MLASSLRPTLIESIQRLTPKPTGQPKVWIEAYGCSASMADSEMIAGQLKTAGYGIAGDRSEGNLNLIVTCSVKDATEHRMLGRIKSLTRSGKPLVIAGCLPKADRARVEALSPSASLIGPHALDRVVEVSSSILSGRKVVALDDSATSKINIPRIRLNPVVSIVEIASGCLSECTFCQTKLAKGWLRSYRIGDIARQIRSDIDDGCKEVWLTSTDNGCYGRDIHTDLVELLKACCTIPESFKIRLGMMNPMYLPGLLDRLVDLFEHNDKLFKFLHIPVESGSDRILGKMKRGHTSKIFLDAVQKFRKRIPEMTISTDVIVGFPSETEEDFEETLALISRAEPDTVNLSRYSARPGTESATWKKERISSQVAKRRSEILHKVAREIARKRNSFWQGWEGYVTVDEISKSGSPQGRNYAYKPVMLDKSAVFLGNTKRVKVYDFSNFSLKARAIL